MIERPSSQYQPPEADAPADRPYDSEAWERRLPEARLRRAKVLAALEAEQREEARTSEARPAENIAPAPPPRAAAPAVPAPADISRERRGWRLMVVVALLIGGIVGASVSWLLPGRERVAETPAAAATPADDGQAALPDATPAVEPTPAAAPEALPSPAVDAAQTDAPSDASPFEIQPEPLAYMSAESRPLSEAPPLPVDPPSPEAARAASTGSGTGSVPGAAIETDAAAGLGASTLIEAVSPVEMPAEPELAAMPGAFETSAFEVTALLPAAPESDAAAGPAADETVAPDVAGPEAVAPAIVPLPQETDAASAAAAATVGKHVVIYVPQNVPRSLREDVVQALQEGRWTLARPKTTAFTISRTNVRYYHATDREAAELLASRVKGSARDFTSYSPSPDQGTLELWVAGRGSALPVPKARVAAAETPETDDKSGIALFLDRLSGMVGASEPQTSTRDDIGEGR